LTFCTTKTSNIGNRLCTKSKARSTRFQARVPVYILTLLIKKNQKQNPQLQPSCKTAGLLGQLRRIVFSQFDVRVQVAFKLRKVANRMLRVDDFRKSCIVDYPLNCKRLINQTACKPKLDYLSLIFPILIRFTIAGH